MLAHQYQQPSPTTEHQPLRLRDDPGQPSAPHPPPPPPPARSRKRKSPASASEQQPPPPPGHMLPPPHTLVHPHMQGPPPPLPPGFQYAPPDYTPGGMPPGPPPNVPPDGQSPNSQGASSGGRMLSNSKRAEQNRKAQRAFRERRDQHVKALESRSQLLDAALASADEANRRWEECRALVDQLRIENAALRAALSQTQMISTQEEKHKGGESENEGDKSSDTKE